MSKIENRGPKPYLELGRLFETWRSSKYKSCLAVSREPGFPLSYDSYVDIEKGKTLPSVDVISKLAEFFKQDERGAFLIWCKVQIPNADVKSRLAEEFRKVEAGAPASQKVEPVSKTAPVQFETTWVLGPSDRKLLEKDPWLWDICLRLASAHPQEVPFEKFKKLGDKKTLLKKTKKWVADNHLFASAKGLGLRLPYIWIPKTPEWNQVRRNNFLRVIDAAYPKEKREKAQLRFSFLFHRSLTSGQVQEWVTRLQELEKAFTSAPYVLDEEELAKGESVNSLSVIFTGRSTE